MQDWGGGILTCLPGCSKKDEPLPAAAPSGAAAAAGARAKAQTWFAGLQNASAGRSVAKGTTASRTAEEAQPTIDWEQAIYSDEYVIAPFAETANPFVDGKHYGYRFLVVRTAGDTDDALLMTTTSANSICSTSRPTRLRVSSSPSVSPRSTRKSWLE